MENEGTKIKKILTTEIKYIIGIIVFVTGVVAPYYSIKTDIALIKQNHLAHLDLQSSELEELNKKYLDLKEISNKQQVEIIELMKTLARIK